MALSKSIEFGDFEKLKQRRAHVHGDHYLSNSWLCNLDTQRGANGEADRPAAREAT